MVHRLPTSIEALLQRPLTRMPGRLRGQTPRILLRETRRRRRRGVEVLRRGRRVRHLRSKDAEGEVADAEGEEDDHDHEELFFTHQSGNDGIM